MQHNNIVKLHDVVHSEKRIWLVFKYLDLDLKKFMDSCPEFAKSPALIKTRRRPYARHQGAWCSQATNVGCSTSATQTTIELQVYEI
ncbi:cell division control protein 2 homolog [Triticum urartu]|uniref:cell division control protein 2 homolog n=1 Tax=Triticum urartu TaxID=4572 RepID=UPI002042D4BC|nr:cell division control protein 2 homolog [Triticum urartu]XP_048547032.1 cell division control protein 2 homolog [Triticum urartu]